MGKKARAQNRAKIESDSGLRAIEAMIEPRERCRECMTTLDGDAPRNLDPARPWRVNRTET